MRIARITFALLFVIVSVLTVGCAGSSSVLTPPDSPYPADIIGRVTIAKKIILDNRERVALTPDRTWWIIEVSLRNKDYELPVNSKHDPSIPSPKGVASDIWLILRGDEGFAHVSPSEPPMSVFKGQSGTMIFFGEVIDINPADAQICYRGQEPYSYGKLITGDSVAVYDWDLKKAVQEQEVEVSRKTNIATVYDIHTAATGYKMEVILKPTKSALPNKTYIVDVFEKGELRYQTTVSWNQPEINILRRKIVYFPLSRDEHDAYWYADDVSHIFSVEVHE